MSAFNQDFGKETHENFINIDQISCLIFNTNCQKTNNLDDETKEYAKLYKFSISYYVFY